VGRHHAKAAKVAKGLTESWWDRIINQGILTADDADQRRWEEFKINLSFFDGVVLAGNSVAAFPVLGHLRQIPFSSLRPLRPLREVFCFSCLNNLTPRPVEFFPSAFICGKNPLIYDSVLP